MMSLTGKRILLTRSAKDALPYAEAFNAHGAVVTAIPMIRIVRLADSVLHERVTAIRQADLIVWTSSNAVRQLLSWLTEHRPADLDFLRQRPQYAVGESTAAALQEYLISASWPAGIHDSEGLAHALAREVSGKTVLLPRGTLAMDKLPTILRQHGALLSDLIVYETQSPDAVAVQALRRLFERRAPDAVCFFSPSGFRFFADIVSPWTHKDVAVVAIGRTTASEIRTAGWPVDAIAETPTPTGLLHAVRFVQTRETSLAEK